MYMHLSTYECIETPPRHYLWYRYIDIDIYVCVCLCVYPSVCLCAWLCVRGRPRKAAEKLLCVTVAGIIM